MHFPKLLRLSLALVALFYALPLVPGAEARPAPSAAVGQTHDRFIVLEGGRNFRDVGGYLAADGRTVKWGVFYRSGSMALLTPKGISDFDQLKVTSIIDLRSTDERRRDPNDWQMVSNHGYWSRDYIDGSRVHACDFWRPGQVDRRCRARDDGGQLSLDRAATGAKFS